MNNFSVIPFLLFRLFTVLGRLNSRSQVDNNTNLKEKQTKELLMIEELENEDEVEKEEVDSEEEEDESFQEIHEDEDGEMEEEMFSMKKRKTKSILPIDKTFSASLFLSLIHRELTFEDLKGTYVSTYVRVFVWM